MASSLPVDGALLTFSRSGSGPVLVLVPGANGDAVIFDKVAPILAARFTVCTYDRRGFSRSTYADADAGQPPPADLTMPTRLHADADDLAALIRHVSPAGPALVMGTSSGAIVSLAALSRHPDTMACLVAHEPPLTRALGDGGLPVHAVLANAAAVYAAQGQAAATTAFLGPVDEASAESAAAHALLEDPARAANADLFFRREIAGYTAADLPQEALRAAAAAGRLVLANGEASGPPATSMTEGLAAGIGAAAVEKMPAGHLGYVAQPEKWAARLVEIFASRGKM